MLIEISVRSGMDVATGGRGNIPLSKLYLVFRTPIRIE